MRNVDELPEKESDVARVEDLVIDKLILEMRRMSDQLDQLPKHNLSLSGPRQRDSVPGKVSYWICVKDDHVVRDCSKHE